MASDAKIGLLLGLVFIFIIALIINGLPSFQENENNNELTNNMVRSQNNPSAIAAKQREVIKLREPVASPSPKAEQPTPAAGTQDVHLATAATANPPVILIKENPAEQAIAAAAARAVTAKNESRKTESNKEVLSKTYVVSKGDTLAVIARKVYGADDGNKKVNINKIFDANLKLLKSPDELQIGQKLVIPPLMVASLPNKSQTANILSDAEFAKVESIGMRHLLTNVHRPEQQEQSPWHVVQEGDSLWQIAAKQLGNGSRYNEIAKLNAGVLDGEDGLSVGMRLKMPAR